MRSKNQQQSFASHLFQHKLPAAFIAAFLGSILLLGFSGQLEMVEAQEQEATFSIPTLIAEIQVNADGSMQVKEEISLLFEQKAGATQLVLPLPFGAEAKEVLVRDKTQFKLSEADYDARISEGRIELNLRPASQNQLQTYLLDYQLGNAVRYEQTSDLLEFTPLPANYAAKIGLLSVTLRPPAGLNLASSDLSHDIISSNAQAYHNFELGKFLYVGKDISKQNGFTVQAFLPKSFFPKPAVKNTFLKQQLKLGLVFYPLLAILVLLGIWWRKEHIYSYKGEQLPAPGLLALLAEEKIASRALVATIFSLAQKGHLKIVSQAQSGIFSKRQNYHFVLLKAATPELKQHEHLLLHALFGQEKRIRF